MRERSDGAQEGRLLAAEETEGRARQQVILDFLGVLPRKLYKDREDFERALDTAARKTGIGLAAPVRKAILSALSEREETAEICRDKHGWPRSPVLQPRI